MLTPLGERPVTDKRGTAIPTLCSTPVMPSLWLSSVSLHNFRNYAELKLDIAAGPVLVVGPNGAGKTNLLEAVSLLAPGRGMRRARAEHLARRDGASGGVIDWAVAAVLQTQVAPCRIGTGVPGDSETGRRVMRLEGETVAQTEIGMLLSASWLTPQMDGIFIDSPSARRRFLDRLVIAFDPAHIARTNRYEKMLRERTILVADGCADETWLTTLETKLAETAVAITAARLALIADLNIEAEQGWFGFPGASLELTGDTESWLATMPALAVEEKLAAAAKQARLNGDRPMPGPHASELCALHLQTLTPAVLASTGQQKALLIAVILAHARLQQRRLGRPPLMLLDDVAAHLDVKRRSSLFEAVGDLGAQSWFSGTDIEDFDGLKDQAQVIRIDGSATNAESLQIEVV